MGEVINGLLENLPPIETCRTDEPQDSLPFLPQPSA